MLTADLVHVRRRGDRLVVVPIDEAARPRAVDLAGVVLSLVRAHVGSRREDLALAWSHVDVAPAEQRLARGLWKLALDACEFEEEAKLDPVEVRRRLFRRAADFRRAGRSGDRNTILADVGRELGCAGDTLDQAMYADLPAAHVLRRADLPSPAGLVATYELASHQAVLLRAVQLQARVWSASGSTYRALFRTLKFRRLLYGITAIDSRGHGGRGYAIDLDGPMSLFEQTTKYGLNLALALPAIMACDAWEVRADVRWGKDRRPLRYHIKGGEESGPVAGTIELPDEVAALLADLRRQDTPWQASPSEAILSLPGVGVCVPDLEFVHRDSGQRVFLEVLGFWSRAAIWKRIEMATAGLPVPVVFAVSKHLRVSEEALPADAPAALYVYARALSARALLDRVDAVATSARA